MLDNRAIDSMEDLREPLIELGRRWARSSNRPRPKRSILNRWDERLNQWIATTSLPILLRKSSRRGESATCSSGRKIIFADNSPATWAFGLALAGKVPDIRSWTCDSIATDVTVRFTNMGAFAEFNLNNKGWRVCHIEPVSNRSRRPIENVPIDEIEGTFLRFLSPRNIFLIPKQISGAGELREVINAVAEYEAHRG